MIQWLPLLIAASMGEGSVSYALNLDKTEYRVGEPIVATLEAKNKGKKDVLLVRALWDGAPAAQADASLYREGKRVETFGESSMPMVQVIVDNRVKRTRFLVVKPGQVVTLYTMKFQGEWDFGTGKERDKAAYERAKQKPIATGSYECRASYSFDPDKVQRQWFAEWGQTIDFGPGAQSLWKRTMKADVKLEGPFVVR